MPRKTNAQLLEQITAQQTKVDDLTRLVHNLSSYFTTITSHLDAVQESLRTVQEGYIQFMKEEEETESEES